MTDIFRFGAANAMTAAFIGFVIISLARDVGNRFTNRDSASPAEAPKGRYFDRSL